MLRSSRGVLGVGACLLAATGAAALPTDSREILATGDYVTRLGRVGLPEFFLHCFDDNGRALVSSGTSDGRVGLYWSAIASDTRVWTGWSEWERGNVDVSADWARSSPDGRIVVVGTVSRLWQSDNASILLLQDGQTRTLVSLGDDAGNGERVCGLDVTSPKGGTNVNDSGAVAFWASLAPAEEACPWEREGDHPGFPWALYVFDEHGLRVIARDGEVTREGWEVRPSELLHVSNDGTILFVGRISASSPRRRLGIFASRDGEIRALVADGDPGPSGALLALDAAVAANGLGEVAFTASETDSSLLEGEPPGLYRTDRGAVVRVALRIDERPDGGEFRRRSDYRMDPVSLNDAGDVAVSGWWMEQFSPSWGGSVHGVIVYSGDGKVEVIRDATNGILNDRRELAYKTYGPPQAVVVRRPDGVTQPLVVAGDPAPGSGYFGTSGVGMSSLAASGLVVSTVYSADDGRGLVCLDQQGAHLVAKDGDPAPGGGTLTVESARFVSDGEIVFSGARTMSESDPRLVEGRMYRATPQGIELLPPWREERGAYNFSVNSRGTVLFYLPDWRFTRVSRDGGVERLWIDRYDFGQGERIAEVESFGLAADDTIVALVRFVEDGGQQGDPPTAVVHLTGNDGTVVATAGGPDLAGGPFAALGSQLLVAENLALFSAHPAPHDATGARHFLYDLSGGTLRADVLPGDLALSSSVAWDLTPGGRVLFEAVLTGGEKETVANFAAADGMLELLSLNTGMPVAPGDPVAINDRGNVLYESGYEDGLRSALSLRGPTPSAACFVPPTASSATFTPSPSATLASWPVTETPALPSTPTPSDCDRNNDEPCVRIAVGSAVAHPGDAASFEVRLHTGALAVAGVQIDVSFGPEVQIIADASGRPSCRVNPRIDKNGTVFNFLPRGCEPGAGCSVVRAFVLALDSVEAIPDDSVLYVCDVAVAPTAVNGQYPLTATGALASTPEGNEIPALGLDGEIVVNAPTEQSDERRIVPVTRSGGGCSVGAQEYGGMPFPNASALLTGLIALLVRRRQRRSGPMLTPLHRAESSRQRSLRPMASTPSECG
jgi:hypothetical protein